MYPRLNTQVTKVTLVITREWLFQAMTSDPSRMKGLFPMLGQDQTPAWLLTGAPHAIPAPLLSLEAL